MTTNLSVIIPAYNAGDTLLETIESARTSGANEVIVIDDGSSDDTALVARRAGADTVRQTNQGAHAARQVGLARARGDYVVFLDADDLLIPAGVAESVRVLESVPEAVAAGGETLGLWPDGSERIWPRKYERITVENMLRTGFGPWPPGAAVIRRSALADEDPELPARLGTRFAEDYELFLRLAIRGVVARHDVASVRYRLYMGKSTRFPLAVLESKERIRRYYAAWLGVSLRTHSPRALRSQALMHGARYESVTGRRAASVRRLLEAAVEHPVRFGECVWQFVGPRVRARRHAAPERTTTVGAPVPAGEPTAELAGSRVGV
ncbi:glycosyltransferase family 2 protein [Georgenia alba]|uniref:Glycosyltransferase family 2 protein n=1 Tax=Georgenia alba TaxID=2233858 RepID=A0ABW2Q5B3_9MICO